MIGLLQETKDDLQELLDIDLSNNSFLFNGTMKFRKAKKILNKFKSLGLYANVAILSLESECVIDTFLIDINDFKTFIKTYRYKHGCYSIDLKRSKYINVEVKLKKNEIYWFLLKLEYRTSNNKIIIIIN